MFLSSITLVFIILSILSMPGISNSTKYVKKNDTESELTSKDARTPIILLSISLLIIVGIFMLQFESINKLFTKKIKESVSQIENKIKSDSNSI